MGWQRPSDLPYRQTLIDTIIKRVAPFYKLEQKLVDHVRTIEVILYDKAGTLKEYADLSTLSSRLEKLGDGSARPTATLNQQRLMLVLHARECGGAASGCKVPQCAAAMQLATHMRTCVNSKCQTPGCLSTRIMLIHYEQCGKPECSLCGPVLSLRQL